MVFLRNCKQISELMLKEPYYKFTGGFLLWDFLLLFGSFMSHRKKDVGLCPEMLWSMPHIFLMILALCHLNGRCCTYRCTTTT